MNLRSLHRAPDRASSLHARRAWGLCGIASLLLALLAWPLQAGSTEAADDGLAAQVRQFAQRAVPDAQTGLRIEVELGTLDPRLKLAPCERTTPYLPPQARLWGATRIGVRCDAGPSRWNVFLPLRVKVFARASTPATDLPAGTVLQAAHLAEAEVDLAGEPSAAVRRSEDAIGRALARSVRRGQSLRLADLKPRQWFAAGDTVRVLATGSGFSIVAEGQALGAGLEGQTAKIRIDGGRIVSGRASGERQVEVAL